jgi:hypothetical protein
MAGPQRIYKVQEAGGAGRCFFNSIHDSILSREQEFTPKKEILQNIYTCFNISKADYDSKTTPEEKKLQFNKDIRTYLAKKIREKPSEFQKLAKHDFLNLYMQTINKEPLEETKNRGERDINLYPGYYEYLSNPETYILYTADNELFELQREGAISSDAIQTMGKDNFYKLIANVLEKNNYSTYAMAPIIFLLNYCLSNCQPQGYIINILFATENIQAGAQKLTVYRDNKDLIAIPVYKTFAAHYQAVVQVQAEPTQDIFVQQSLVDESSKKEIQTSKQQAIKDIEKYIQEIQNKYKDFSKTKELAKQKKGKDKNKEVQLKFSGDSMTTYVIPKEFFTQGQWYKSEQEAGGEPIVEPFLITGIIPKGTTKYELQIQMLDGTSSSILIDKKNGHFVSYVMLPDDDSKKVIEKAKLKPKEKPKQVSVGVIEKKPFDTFKKNIEGILGEEIIRPEQKEGESKKFSFEDFKQKITKKFGGFRNKKKRNQTQRKSKKSRKSLTRRKE